VLVSFLLHLLDKLFSWGRQHCDRKYCVTLSERELTAEAGLCVVVPCSFTTGVGFTPKHIVWYKCEASQKLCSEPDIIFHSNKITDKKAQAEFEGRVSRLEPDVTQKNCSIIINELKESDSGSYQFRVTGEKSYFKDNHVEKEDICSCTITYLPTVMIPTLTEGQQATLTCTAPGLCSGSVPEITWTWRGTENLVDFTQRHISTLTFNASSEHHNTSITCKINFTCGKTTEETLTVNVNCGGVTTVKEGDVLNLTCSVESFPPSVIVWSKLGSDTKLHNDNGSATLVISNATAEHSGQYICAVTYMNNSLKKDISVTVICKYTIFFVTCPLLKYTTEITEMYFTDNRAAQIIGNTTVREGDVLNLTCSVDSFPPSVIVWSKLGSDTKLHNDTGSATLVVHNVTSEHSGQYICTVKHLDTTLNSYVDVTVTCK
uniref:B-cell receptor CD22 n=1 Tax=Astatotilapia calliptera TaxID=8154 RepID=A0A3P8NEX7_ASTCA